MHITFNSNISNTSLMDKHFNSKKINQKLKLKNK
jgi:hypothetical protein